MGPNVGVLGWFKEVAGEPGATFSVKLRGNILHVLCETEAALAQAPVLLALVRGLLEETGKGLILQHYPQVYQLYFYNRVLGEQKPVWTAPIYLNRLKRHLAQLVLESQDEGDIRATQQLLEHYTDGDPNALNAYAEDGAGGAIVLSNLSLARKGDPDAIAWYLSETLSALDVGVWVSIKAIPGTAHLQSQAITANDGADGNEEEIPRLWVLCEAAYSPDPALVAQPTARRLRQLQLTQYRDAVLLLQVRGEARPDWSLRIDLTPADEMLREWGRWGDAEAIARLVNNALEPLQLRVEAEVKGTTLHLICQPLNGELSSFPEWAAVEEFIAPLLETLAPQGLHQALVYAQPESRLLTPTWVGCLDLPGQEHEALGVSPEALAVEGDLPAVAFLLTRVLNPNLDEHLEIGGQRVRLLVRDRLLHVMVDAPIAPKRRPTAKAIIRRLKRLNIAGIQGVRIYGRRSGQPQPDWSYGKDFEVRRRLVPEATPEFSASDAYVNELLARPEASITATDLPEPSLGQQPLNLLALLRGQLVRSQLFSPSLEVVRSQATADVGIQDGIKIALVWGAMGLLLTLQLDWVFGQLMQPPLTPGAAEATALPDSPEPTGEAEAANAALSQGEESQREQTSWEQSPWGRQQASGEDTGFAAEGFTDAEAGSVVVADGEIALPASPNQPWADIEALIERSPYPSFRSQQLDEKLALYHLRLQQGAPPDVLVVGSSRALRGIDPVALRQELASLGYADATVFNFGVNGATAQVVDFTLRRLLPPSQLPKLILWADGARAFNSGREDITYNAIATSEGYRELVNGRLALGTETIDSLAAAQVDAEASFPERSLADSYQEMDRWFSDQLSSLSAVHSDRERLKTWVQQRVAALAEPLQIGQQSIAEKLDAPMPEGSSIDVDGFLALPVRFNPATYYQNFARVSGRYDGDYKDFRLDGRQDEAFRELLAFAQSQTIPIVFVNTPLTDEYLDAYRRQAEDAFSQYMLRLSTTEEGFIFRDLGRVWQDRYDYFSDPSHLNRYGAYQVSNHIARDPMIPWRQAARDN